MSTAVVAKDPAEVIKDFEAALGKKLDAFNAEQKSAVDAAVKTEVEKGIAAMRAEMARHSLPGAAEETHKGEKFSFSKALGSMTLGEAKGRSVAPLEWEVRDQLMKKSLLDGIRAKAMSFGIDTAGGFFIPTEVLQDQLIPLLYSNTVLGPAPAGVGATRLANQGNAVIQIPRVSGGVTSYWIGEASTITASDMAGQMIKLEPHGLAALTIRSVLLGNLGNPGFDAMLKADMAKSLGLKAELGILRGTGASGQPLGLAFTSGVNTSAVTYNAPTYDELSDAIGAVEQDNALNGNLGWVMAWDDLQYIRKIKDVTGGTDNKSNIQPLGPRSLLEGTRGQETLLGFPVRMSTQLTAGDNFFGNWSDLVIADWGAMALDMTDALGFLTAQTHVRALMFLDSAVRHPVSFNVG